MPKLVVYSIAILSILLILGGYVGWTLIKSNNPSDTVLSPTPIPSAPQKTQNPTVIDNSSTESTPGDGPSPTQDSSTVLLDEVEQARNDGLMYLQAVHPEVSFLFTEDGWRGGAINGANMKFDYSAGGWNVTVEVSSATNPVFTITAKYSGDWQVSWRGTDQNATITELSYLSDIPKVTPAPT